MRRAIFRIHGFSRHVTKRYKNWMVKWLGFTLVFLGVAISLQAEIYKWQDETGTLWYSNKPPGDPARMLEQIPMQNVPFMEDANGVVYYLGNTGKEIFTPDVSGFTLSPDMINELMKTTPAVSGQSSSQPSLGLTALTIRLAEVEKALEREIENRVEREKEDTQTQSLIKDLESQNKTLMLALAQMETVIKRQADVLNVQDKQIKAIEAKLLQLSAQPAESQTAGETTATSGIRIVEKKERRKPLDLGILSWFRKSE